MGATAAPRPGTAPEGAGAPYGPAAGGARSVYDHRDPLGLALMPPAPLTALGGILPLRDSGSWSREGTAGRGPHGD
ncbi:hypothetical protein [Streptomyces sp. BBFR102]|uniref:hypothetical protein n=1 Tax=Streptomyces sp. BBFR102 TaxID=3448171 RepID=UPI003F52E0F6